jgi:FkbM family methyltransferase
MKWFPNVRYLLIEAQARHEPALRAFCDKHPNAEYILAAAGDKEGTIFFDGDDPLGGQASTTQTQKAKAQVSMTTIDLALLKTGMSGPLLIKLDTHGFEVPILAGAKRALDMCDVLFVECYNYKMGPECLVFWDMCAYLLRLGFRCIDMADPMHRPYDGSLWQMDFVFIKCGRPEFQYLHYNELPGKRVTRVDKSREPHH